ncbi:MAG TPA: response regulator transcription factor [Rhodocyclaceae bacterium]|nr:response regulator transcription factor [Rhodocyclaceae bacterium]
MSRASLFLLTADETIFARFRPLEDRWTLYRLSRPVELETVPADSLVVIDASFPQLPELDDPRWRKWCGRLVLVFASSAPDDTQGLAALEAGASGYCHAYSSEVTLRQILDVVAAGELWVGRSLMGRLLRSVDGGIRGITKPPHKQWRPLLTEREREVTLRAARGESNLDIADALGITERTVKAHMTAIFEKLEVADRLQLALKVHGIK